MVRINLRQFLREWSAKNRRNITYKEIHEATGIAEATIDRMLNEKSQRVDLDVLARFCKLLGVKSGPVPFIIYEEDDESP